MWIRCLLAREIEEIHDGLERIVDLVRDGGRDSAGGGDFLAWRRESSRALRAEMSRRILAAPTI